MLGLEYFFSILYKCMYVWMSGQMQLKRESEKIGNMASRCKRKIVEKNGEVIY